MARWWCRTAARICAVPAPRTCCNGPKRSGKSSAPRGQKVEAGIWRKNVVAFWQTLARAVNCLPNHTFTSYPSSPDDGGAGHLQVTIMGEPDRIMARPILTSLLASTLLCAGASLALAQG